MKLDYTERELKHNDTVRFIPATSKYGNAEFTFCLHRKRGALKTIFITPKQQPDTKEKFKIQPNNGATGCLVADSWSHKGIERPYIWLHFWCTDHQASAFHLYVPSNSNMFKVEILSDIGIYFDFEGGLL